ncbi:MAG: hypothetical protein LBB98_01665 [Treponema sp.]|nr:hypothetical protein [Treponema sp.]
MAGRGLGTAGETTGKLREFPQTRHKLALIGLAVCAVLLVLCVTAILTGGREDAGTGSDQDLSEVFSPRAVPPEEFFLPEEPDFLPKTLPEREKRKSWTVEDARPFWIDPLTEGASEYTDLMSGVIDDVMERIP